MSVEKSQPSVDADTGIRPEWFLVGNIVKQRPYGEGGLESRPGTKHFSGGTKVYCLPPQWGDGFEQVVVIGRHRGSRRHAVMVIPQKSIENWRAKLVYSPTILQLALSVDLPEKFARYWDEDHARSFAKSLNSA